MQGVQGLLDVVAHFLVFVLHGQRPIGILQAGVPDAVRVGPASPEAVEREAIGVHLAGLAHEDGRRVRPALGGKHGTAHALGDDDGLLVGGHLVAVALGERGVLVDEVLHEVLHVLGDFLQRVVAARPHLRSIAPRRRLLHVGAARVAVELALAGTAVAGGLVGVARHAGEHLQHAAVLDGVAVLVGGQLEVDAAVAVARIDAGRPHLHGLFGLLAGHAGDLLHLVPGVLARQIVEAVPHGAALVGLAVLQGNGHLAGEQRGLFGQAGRIRDLALLVAFIPIGVELGVGRVAPHRRVGQPAGSHETLERMLDEGARGRDLVHLAFPLALFGIPVGQTVVVLVPYHEALVLAALDDVGLGDELRAHVDAAVALHKPALGLPGLVVAEQEGGVGPAAHHGVVVGLVLDDPVEPAERQRAVGAGAQRQPDVGFLGKRRHARIDADVRRGMRGHVRNGAVSGVVVGVLHGGAPLQVHLRLGLHLHPGGTHLVGHDACPVARALADLVGQVRVRRTEQLLHALVGAKRPHARGAAHNEDGLSAVLIDDLAQALARQLEGLVQGDAHPTGIIGALGVRALHGVTQTIGVIGRMHGRLRLRAAMAAALGCRFVAFDLDGLAVLHRHPDAALHLAASTAARAHVLQLASGSVGIFGESSHGRDRRGTYCCSRTGDSHRLHEVATRHG